MSSAVHKFGGSSLQSVDALNQVADIIAASPSGESDSIALVLLGYGNIGRQLVSCLSQQLAVINRQAKKPLQLVAIANSRHYIFDPQGLMLAQAEQALGRSHLSTDDIGRSLELLGQRRVAVIDVTASAAVADHYQDFFARGWDVISAGKLGMTLPSSHYRHLCRLVKRHDCRWLSNVSCGAGLPVQQTLRELVLAGDRIERINGVFSGSLSWILANYDGSEGFSAVVAKAKRLGLTEPDPREDLSGKDVQRKLLILARTLGLTLDLEDIELTPLIPAHFLDLTAEQFAAAAADLDSYMQQQWQQANAQGLRLCYRAELALEPLVAYVGLSLVGATEPLGGLLPADNMVVIESQWYHSNPLLIRGPGAGIEVTAAGIVADLLRLG